MNISKIGHSVDSVQERTVNQAPTLCQRVAALARQIFDAIASFCRSCCQVFDADNWRWLFPKQIEIAEPLEGVNLAQPRLDGIKVGMPNTGNTCWFNSLMKFMASTDHFDDCLREVLGEDERKKEVRARLRALFHTLRSADEGVLKTKDYLDLLGVMKKVDGFADRDSIGRKKFDPDEFLSALCNDLHFRTNPYIVVRPDPDVGLSIPKASYFSMGLQQFNDWNSSGRSIRNASADSLPDTIIVTIRRPENDLNALIETDVIQVPLVNRDSDTGKLVADSFVSYRIVAGIERKSWEHYVSWEAIDERADGDARKVIQHDDRHVSHVKNHSYQNSNTVLLKKIPTPDPN